MNLQGTPRPRPSRTIRLCATAACAVLAVLLTGCVPRPAPVLTMTPSTAAPGQALHVALTGLEPGASVVLRLTTAPASGPAWSAAATFRADANGTVSTRRAPVSGDYTGARPEGLEEALHAPRGDASPFQAPTASPWRLQITASVSDHVVARGAAVRRTCLSSVTLHRLTLAADHVLGILYEPKRPATSREPGVVTIGGSSGGLGMTGSACDLAATGIPALSVAYFHEAGLPTQLERIPIEYFAAAARILAKAPGVDPDHVVLWGDSRGSEAAVLIAAHYATLVHGLILTVPAAVAGPAPSSPGEAAWTYRGSPVPTEGIGPALTNPRAAELPIDRSQGPALAVCAGKDAVWPSCPQAMALRTRARSESDTSRFALLTYPSAGHFVGPLTPNYPSTATDAVADGNTTVSGGTPLADAEARDDAWPRLLAWLHHQYAR